MKADVLIRAVASLKSAQAAIRSALAPSSVVRAEAEQECLASIAEIEGELAKVKLPVEVRSKPRRRRGKRRPAALGRIVAAADKASAAVKPAETTTAVEPEPVPEVEESAAEPTVWWEDFQGVVAHAIEAGVVAVPGQSFEHYRARVFAALGPGAHLDAADAETKAMVRKYQIDGINPPAPPVARRQPVQSGR